MGKIAFGIMTVAALLLVGLGIWTNPSVKKDVRYFLSGPDRPVEITIPPAKVSDPVPKNNPAPIPTPIEPTPTVAATTEPENEIKPVLEVLEEPDPTPVIRIPEIQYSLRPLEDNSNPSRPAPLGSGGPPMPPEIPQPLPPAPPTPARQFDGGDLVQWVAGEGIVNQGQIQAYKYSKDAQMWVYDVKKDNGHLWQALEENRMTLVTKGSLPFDTSVIGREVMAFDLETGIVLEEGVVEQVIKMPDHWAYLIREEDCSSFNSGNALIVLVDLLVQSCQTSPAPVPPVEPMPEPTPIPATQTPTPKPTEEAPTLEPNEPEPEAQPEAPTPDEDDEDEGDLDEDDPDEDGRDEDD